MENYKIIAIYEALLVTTGEMLQAAQESDWDRLILLEQQCRELTDTLVSGNTGQILDAGLRQRKTEIIRRVLAHDAEIRNLTQPWMAQLQDILGSTNREHKLLRAYRPANDS